MLKEDGTTAKAEETLDFKVLEFAKDQKKIIVSHTKINQEVEEAKEKEVVKTKKDDENSTKKAIKKMKDSQEKTTLGDIQALSDLKSEMETKSKKAAKAASEASEDENK